MLRAIRLLVLPTVVVGLLLALGATEAQAQIRVQIGGFGLNGGSVYRGGHRFYSNQPRTYSSYRPSYNLRSYGNNIHYGHSPRVQSYHGGHGYYHDTTHFDYHPPQIYRHGNHWDVVPGHYDLHRSGHYHH